MVLAVWHGQGRVSTGVVDNRSGEHVCMKKVYAFVMVGLSLVAACTKEPDEAEMMKEYEQREAAGLISTWNSQHNVINTSTDCMMLGNPRTLPDGTLQQVQKICQVEYPRALLVEALTDLRKDGQVAEANSDPLMRDIDASLREMKCFVILLADAYKSARTRDPVDPSVKTLFDEYAVLCPKQATKVQQQQTAL